jgi:hypothetical protein
MFEWIVFWAAPVGVLLIVGALAAVSSDARHNPGIRAVLVGLGLALAVQVVLAAIVLVLFAMAMAGFDD